MLFSVTISSVEPVNWWPSEFWLKFSYCWFDLPSFLFVHFLFILILLFSLFLDDRNSEDPLIKKLSKDMGIQINLIDEPSESESKSTEHSMYIRKVSSKCFWVYSSTWGCLIMTSCILSKRKNVLSLLKTLPSCKRSIAAG